METNELKNNRINNIKELVKRKGDELMECFEYLKKLEASKAELKAKIADLQATYDALTKLDEQMNGIDPAIEAACKRLDAEWEENRQ